MVTGYLVEAESSNAAAGVIRRLPAPASHISGAGLGHTATPRLSTTSNPPAACATSLPPVTAVPSRRERTACVLPAAGVLTIRCWVNDEPTEVNLRSTPGYTSE